MSEETALKDFLRKQARSLDSLLELTPAKNMFGEDVSDQWQRKKQTPEQKKVARMAKLDPANWKSAKDVYDERSAEAAKKRKREQEGNGESQEPETQQEQPVKKQKTTDNHAQPKPKPKPTEKLTDRLDSERLQNMNLKKKMKKRAHRAEKKQQRREQHEDPTSEEPAQIEQTATDKKSSPLEQKKPSKRESREIQEQVGSASGVAQKERGKPRKEITPAARPQERPQKVEPQDEAVVDKHEDEDKEVNGVDEAWSDVEEESSEFGQAEASNDDDEDEEMADADSTATSSEGVPDILSPPHDSASSSVSSVVPPAQTQSVKAAHKPDTKNESEPAQLMDTVQTDAERQAARQRLQEQISQFRSQRKADDKPVRSRAELLAQRRQKEQERKAAKKEQRRKEKEEEAKRQDEEMARRFSPGGSGSLLASPRSPMIDDGGSNAFAFGRIAFDDGTQFDAATGSAAANKKHKGPADPATALKAAQAKQARVAALDDQKKQGIEEKDMWLNAKKRAHGERVKDDTSLLKKALKRQEKQKQRSGKDWDARVEGVRSSQEAKQKRRTENLQKRKDEKGGKKTTSKKKVKRPGFEGSFRGRAGKSKKN
ncbi:hypothetical protein LTR70_001856 [Exophiala xenobiotica]|uniref:SURF6-domain-containing protein n=1 Tax=Lithohypha guttulata TaxID=1690604 RepID=A0ABR0KAD1_9EURO|nr:hypothetical protein LTR24_005142 [Lithohypha guttulata]KAK5326842.1 hypothetical protein LTR70_001856 [Exophiala xenobiotica]